MAASAALTQAALVVPGRLPCVARHQLPLATTLRIERKRGKALSLFAIHISSPLAELEIEHKLLRYARFLRAKAAHAQLWHSLPSTPEATLLDP